MHLSARDLTTSAFLIITSSTVVSNIYKPIWVYVYAVINLVVVTSFSLLKNHDIWKNNIYIKIVHVYSI